MKRVEFKYKGFSPVLRSTVVRMPERWNELSERQFRAVADQMFAKLSVERFYCIFFGIRMDILYRMDGFQVFKLSEAIQFVSDTTLPCNVWLLGRLGVLRAPAANLSGVTLQQWMTADSFFSRYISTGREEFLNNAIAAVYLKKGYHFSGKKIVNLQKEAEYISRFDLVLRKAIALNFVLVRNWLSVSYPHLFPVVVKSAPGSKGKGTDWLEIFDRLVGDNLPQIDEYKKMSVTDAFRIMNRRIKEAKK